MKLGERGAAEDIFERTVTEIRQISHYEENGRGRTDRAKHSGGETAQLELRVLGVVS